MSGHARKLVKLLTAVVLCHCVISCMQVQAQEIVLTQVGNWTEGHSEAVAIDGTSVYAGVDSALVILDVSDPAQPVELGRTKFGERPMAVEVRGEHVFLLDEPGLLHVVRTADPSAPAVISSKDVRVTEGGVAKKVRSCRRGHPPLRPHR